MDRKSDAVLLSVMLAAAFNDPEECSLSRTPLAIDCAATIAGSIVSGSDEEISARAAKVDTSGECAPEVARLLLDELDAHENTWKPATALAVARAAERLVDGVADLPHLTFRAIKEQANALRLLGDLDEALRQIDRAEVEACCAASAEFHVAVAAYARAAILCEIGRTLEAATLLSRARAVFSRHGDYVRLERAITFEATILYRERRYDEAMALYRGALMSATERGDVERAAMELGNIGHCYTRKGNLRSAREYLASAADMYNSLGMPIQRARILRSMARVAIRETGRRSHFDEAAAAFDSLGMIGEWSLTQLALAEELKLRDEHADVSMICQQVYTRASKAGMVVTAAEVLQMLANAGQSRDATPDMVRQVASTIDAGAMESQVFEVN